jgi:transposase
MEVERLRPCSDGTLPDHNMLRSHPVGSIPEETLRIATAALPAGNIYISLRDHLGTIFDDSIFGPIFPERGQPATTPWRLALVTILQFAEGLSDRDVAEAVRTRIDWKYLLGLELTDPGFGYSILSRSRSRLVDGHAEQLLLEKLLDECKSSGLLRARTDVRTDSTHVLASVRKMNRSELVGETLRAGLNVLSRADPGWVAANVDSSWRLKYSRRFGYPREVLSKEAIVAIAEDIGRDGIALLEMIWREDTPSYLRAQFACSRNSAALLGRSVLDGQRFPAVAASREPSAVTSLDRLAIRY